MDKAQAQKVIKETFENKFDKTKFTWFITELLNIKSQSINESGIAFNATQIPNTFKPFINSFEKITDYKSDKNTLDVLVIRLNKETSIERARTMQRNFIAWYLKGGCDGETKDAVLAAFVSIDEKDWRFSLVKMDYSIGEDKKGKVKIGEEFTPAKRWSFLVGANERSHTAQSQLIDILAKDDANITLYQLEEAFNVEKVTKEFFSKYRELFFRTRETLDEIIAEDNKIKTDFEEKNINTVDFSKKLLGQIVFLYFLQKKGWFGVARDADWGTGPKNFLRELFEGKHGKYNNFYNDILEPLFYDALRNDRSHNDDYYSNFNCKIPFLNGGLFDPINNYDWVHTDINLPNDLFSNITKTKEGDGTGILDIFDRYNFTVKEDEPLEKEVAVDPEMLGKVFENLLEVKDRKSKGTYYTPREIVHYMCQQSLINYLATELEEKVPKDDIEKLVKFGEQFGENNINPEDNLKDIPVSISKYADLIDSKLAEIKVCDPAVGSGAFLVGMMGEIVRVRNVLSEFMKNSNRTIYNFKRDCIENSLYGVDIDPGAVEICKLRLWLSLVVDEEDIKQIKPLPNLDYKIVCGNSLMSVEKNLFNQELFGQLENKKKLLFSEINPNKKQEYKNQINDLILQLTNGNQEFDFEIYFSEIFHEKSGFDVVIANPPYVRVDNIEQIMKSKYKKIYKTAIGKYDLYYLFFEKSFLISNLNGVCVFISPNKFCAADSASILRELLIKYIRSGEIISTSRIKIFSEASNYPIISIFRKNSSHPTFLVRQIEYLTQIENKYEFNKHYFASKKDFELLPDQVIPININQTTFNLLKRLYERQEKISKYISVSEGLRIPSIYESEKSAKLKIVKQYQFSKYSRISSGSFISQEKLYKIISVNSDRYKKIFSPKILILEDALQINATLDLENLIPQGGVYFAISKNKEISIKFLLGLLNSKLLSYLYEALYSGMHMGGGYLRYRAKFLENLPLPSIVDLLIIKQIDELVDMILLDEIDKGCIENKNSKIKVCYSERQINFQVYKIYRLTEEEIGIVEGK